MIPVPQSGIFEGVEGIEAAERVPGVTEIRLRRDCTITWRHGRRDRVIWDLFLRGGILRRKWKQRCERRMRGCISIFAAVAGGASSDRTHFPLTTSFHAWIEFRSKQAGG